jgi:hypothetical protein
LATVVFARHRRGTDLYFERIAAGAYRRAPRELGHRVHGCGRTVVVRLSNEERTMARLAAALLLLLSLAGCAGSITAPIASPCVTEGEASWNCQIERYNRVSG